MTTNHDQDIEKSYHPENFDAQEKGDLESLAETDPGEAYDPTPESVGE